jgi:hypothetical protein
VGVGEDDPRDENVGDPLYSRKEAVAVLWMYLSLMKSVDSAPQEERKENQKPLLELATIY